VHWHGHRQWQTAFRHLEPGGWLDNGAFELPPLYQAENLAIVAWSSGARGMAHNVDRLIDEELLGVIGVDPAAKIGFVLDGRFPGEGSLRARPRTLERFT
jgi:hypothetical protein